MKIRHLASNVSLVKRYGTANIVVPPSGVPVSEWHPGCRDEHVSVDSSHPRRCREQRTDWPRVEELEAPCGDAGVSVGKKRLEGLGLVFRNNVLNFQIVTNQSKPVLPAI